MLIDNHEHSDLCVGIDLGTTNSVLATINKKPNGDIISKIVDISRPMDVLKGLGLNESRMSSQKRSLLPSCVYYDEQHGLEPVIGDFAKMQYPNRPHLVAKSIKSQMGMPVAEGLDAAIPDKTPAEISARILKHMLKEAGRVYRQQITDAVITVPANFDSVMCQATRDAAALAGIQIKNSDGSERPVLLSEPNAVIYDLINQVHNGEISSHVIDLSTEKNVMVFDLGGGTLDITMHKIKRREDCPDVLKVDEIATNRYTKLGGDDFDELLAEAMFNRYLERYSKYSGVKYKLEQQKSTIMPVMRNYAEQLKLEVSERYRDGNAVDDSDFGWDDVLEDDGKFEIGGNIGGVGYAYDDSFTKEEVEQILEPLMGRKLSYNDYQGFENIDVSTNIIYPILDVLQKAAAKLQSEPVVDAVIVNGGMSKFYMIIDRLREFFGLEPIVALDSDLAVARGAAVYHYYLHLYDASMKEDMRLLYNTDSPVAEPCGDKAAASVKKEKASENNLFNGVNRGIEFGKTTLNDDLYLGARNGAVQLLVPAGSELPYDSPIIRGFQLDAGCDEIAIPIKRRSHNDSYVTIANGRLKLGKSYPADVYVSIRVNMSSSKLISMYMMISSDLEGLHVLEHRNAEIVIGSYHNTSKVKMAAPVGAKLNVTNEMHKLKQLCDRLLIVSNADRRKKLYDDISFCVKCINAAGNKDEFANEVLYYMQYGFNSELKLRLYTIARKQCAYWSEADRANLATICVQQLNGVIRGYDDKGLRRNLNIQAVYALGFCGSDKQIMKLDTIKHIPAYKAACMYVFGKRHLNTQWICELCYNDVRFNNLRGLQNTLHALGMALRRDEGISVEQIDIDEAVNRLCQVISYNANVDLRYNGIITSALIALGYACDQRFGSNGVSDKSIEKVRYLIDTMEQRFDGNVYNCLVRSITIVSKMLNGAVLTQDEEQFLLRKLEI